MVRGDLFHYVDKPTHRWWCPGPSCSCPSLLTYWWTTSVWWIPASPTITGCCALSLWMPLNSCHPPTGPIHPAETFAESQHLCCQRLWIGTCHVWTFRTVTLTLSAALLRCSGGWSGWDCPLVKVKTERRTPAPWITDGIRTIRRLRRRSERIWPRTNLHVHRQLYVEHRDAATQAIREAKKKYYTEEFSGADQRKAFQVMSGLIYVDRRDLPDAPVDGELCEQFATYFSDKVSKVRTWD